MSYTTAFRTHRWHFIKCKSNITEMSKHKIHAPSTNPRKKIKIITLSDRVECKSFWNLLYFPTGKNNNNKWIWWQKQLSHLIWLVPVLFWCCFPALGKPRMYTQTLKDLAHFPDQRASSIDTTREPQGKMHWKWDEERSEPYNVHTQYCIQWVLTPLWIWITNTCWRDDSLSLVRTNETCICNCKLNKDKPI